MSRKTIFCNLSYSITCVTCNQMWHFLVAYNTFSCIRQVTKDSFSTSDNLLVWNPILLKCILYSFQAQFQNTSCRRFERFWHRQHGQVNDSFICAPRNIERKCGPFIVSMFCIFLVVTLHTMFSRKSHCLLVGPWPWPIMGNLWMLGEHPHLTLTHWAKRYGPLMHLRLGSINTVVASSPTMAKECF